MHISTHRPTYPHKIKNKKNLNKKVSKKLEKIILHCPAHLTFQLLSFTQMTSWLLRVKVGVNLKSMSTN